MVSHLLPFYIYGKGATTMEELIQTEEIATPEDNIPAEQIVFKKKKTLWPILICAAVAVLAAAFFLTMNLRKYSRATQIYERGDYLQAADLYAELGNYRDAAKREADARYVWAGKLAAQKDYEGAIEVYNTLGDHKESVKRARECYYALGDQAIDAKEWDLAAEYFAKATDEFRDAKQRRIHAIYQMGHALFLDGAYEEAQTYFDRLEGQWPQNGGPHFVTFEEALEYIQTQALDLPEVVTVVVANMPGSYILRQDIRQHILRKVDDDLISLLYPCARLSGLMVKQDALLLDQLFEVAPRVLMLHELGQHCIQSLIIQFLCDNISIHHFSIFSRSSSL
jgi:tetratricopeptide (TPR) repeat protein